MSLPGIQEPRKGGFSKGGFCAVQRHSQGNKKYPRIFDPAVRLALRAPQPRKAYLLQKPPSKNPFFLVPEVCLCLLRDGTKLLEERVREALLGLNLG